MQKSQVFFGVVIGLLFAVHVSSCIEDDDILEQDLSEPAKIQPIGAYSDADADADIDADGDGDVDVCEDYPDPPEQPSASFCTAECPCDFGEGDCDDEGAGTYCEGSFVCGYNNGATYGLPASWDVCIAGPECDTFDPTTPRYTFCAESVECPCGIGEGDCDNDDECGGRLICGYNNGAAAGLPSNYEVCMTPPFPGCPVFDRNNLNASFCTTSCPCGLGEGDCDNDDQCRNNLVCGYDIGSDFGMPSYWDVCVMPGVV